MTEAEVMEAKKVRGSDAGLSKSFKTVTNELIEMVRIMLLYFNQRALIFYSSRKKLTL